MTALAETPVLPPSDPADQQELAELATLIKDADGEATLVGPDSTPVRLPAAIYDALVQVIDAMLAGRAITLAPIAQRLTTQEAADLLGLSRPTVVKLLESGEIPFERPGRHRRVRLIDVLEYRDRRVAQRSHALDDMVRASEELGLYDDERPAG